MWLVNVTCARLARLCCTTPNMEGFKEYSRQWYQMQYVACTLQYNL